jgi:dipeptidyl aminopeptidase/acylaminoacyl peptidase
MICRVASEKLRELFPMHTPRRFAVATLLAGVLLTLIVITAFAADLKDVVFKSKLDGTDQRYVVILPDEFDAATPHSALIALHGHGSDRWQFVRDKRDECRAARDVATKQKLIYVSPDYRAKTSWMGPAAEADVVQIIEELKAKYRVNRVIVSGGSMGGTAALTFAALHPELVDGVVSMNGTANLVEYDQFQDAIATSFGGTKAEKPDEYKKRSAELRLDRLTMPIACTTDGKDRAVPPESVLRLVEGLKAKKRPVKLIHRPDSGHSTSYEDATEAFEFVMDAVTKNK